MVEIVNKMNKVLIILGVILIIHAFILTRLIFFPYPELFIYPYLTNHGLKPYSQILDQHFPGLMFFPINFNNLGMTTPEVARVWLISTVILTQLLLFFVAKQLLKDDKKALFVNLLYLVWQPFFEGWVLWIDNFLPLILLPSFYALYKRKIFITGLLLGIAVVFKQTILPLAFITFIYIFWESKNFRKVLTYLTGLITPIMFMLIYIISIGVFNDFIYWAIIFNLTIFAKYGTSLPSSVGFVTRVVFVYAHSLLALFEKEKRLVKILFIFLIGSLMGVFDRADFVHFQPSLPFALLATVIGFSNLRKKALKVLLLIYFFVGFWWLSVFFRGHLSNKVFFFDENTQEVASKIRQYTNTGDKIFVFGAVPHLYQMSDTLPAGDIFVFPFPWFLQVAQGSLLEGLKKDKPEIIVSEPTVEIEGLRIIDFASDIYQYIQSHYQRIDSWGDIIILRKITP